MQYQMYYIYIEQEYFISSQSCALGIRQSTQTYQHKGKAFSMTFVNSIPSKPMHIHSQKHNLTNNLHQQEGKFPSQMKLWAERFHLTLGPTRRVHSAQRQSDRPKQNTDHGGEHRKQSRKHSSLQYLLVMESLHQPS